MRKERYACSVFVFGCIVGFSCSVFFFGCTFRFSKPQEILVLQLSRVENSNNDDNDEHSALLLSPPCPIVTDSTTGHLHLPIQGGSWIPNTSRTLYSHNSISWFQGWDPDAKAPCTFRGHKATQNVLFMGDSTARHIYSFLNGSNTTIQNTKRTNSFRNGNLTFSWRGRMFRETENCPEPCDKTANIARSTEEARTFASRQELDSSIVYSAGVHEIIGWTGRQTPTFNLDLLQKDVVQFLDLLSNYKGKLVWWRPHDLKPGKVQGEAFQVAKRNLKLLSDLFEYFMGDFGALLVDLEYTTKGQAADQAGVHYPALDQQHAIILEHALHALESRSTVATNNNSSEPGRSSDGI